MKILYVAMRYDYGQKSRGYSFEHLNFYPTFLNMGYDVTYFDFDVIAQRYGRDGMNKKLIEAADKIQPDLIFSVLQEDEFVYETFRILTLQKGFLTVNWFCDDHWRFENYSLEWSSYFKYVITTDSASVKKYQDNGVFHVIRSQWAANPSDYFKLDIPHVYDVTFVGMPHGNRRQVIHGLRKKGIRVKCFGYGWNDITKYGWFKPIGHWLSKIPYVNALYWRFVKAVKRTSRVSHKRMIEIFNQSKINLNLSNSSTNASSQIKGRNFEVPACGAFLLTNHVKGL
ncbi:MAG: hypothetical protein KC713_06605, partial [Candidatus Omnitrophica bacterium]|nr:hypothetical protein [Candidatus Omnitrophota bacterium]